MNLPVDTFIAHGPHNFECLEIYGRKKKFGKFDGALIMQHSIYSFAALLLLIS